MAAVLRQALRGRRVVLLRHGNTGKAEVDSQRELTEKGVLQCEKFREAWKDVLKGVTNVLASSVARTMSTATLIAEPMQLGEVRPLDDLYFGTWRTEDMKTADSELGYAAAGDVLAKFPHVYDPAAAKMAEAVSTASADFSPGDVLIVGHATYLSMLALEIVQALAPAEAAGTDAWLASARQAVLNANVGEVCGFEVCSGTGARYLPNPESTDFAAASSNDAFVTGKTEPAASLSS
eukprot:TRINITY_DN106162_c0_g1_i1.p1 TRINITY_DN106162_c0_g1~~TRINITY_DN106162_c0_g1_i1.p1  ORF type:complete len:236 (+),score=44.61 TRINITY_DN106162_c0_g1_i1:131-838(+)